MPRGKPPPSGASAGQASSCAGDSVAGSRKAVARKSSPGASGAVQASSTKVRPPKRVHAESVVGTETAAPSKRRVAPKIDDVLECEICQVSSNVALAMSSNISVLKLWLVMFIASAMFLSSSHVELKSNMGCAFALGILLALAQADGVTWAAYANVSANGARSRVPVGPGCETCWRRVVELLGFPTLSAFLDVYNKEAEDGKLHLKLQTIKANQQTPNSQVTWDPVEAASQETWEIEVEKRFRGYESKPLREALELQRLTANAVHGVPEVLVPSLTRPGDHTSLFLFQHPGSRLKTDDEGHDVIIRSKATYQSSTLLLSQQANLWAEHGAAALQKASSSDENISNARRACNKPDLPTLSDFASTFHEKKNLEKQKGAKADKQIVKHSLEGAASDEFQVSHVAEVAAAVEVDNQGLLVDLTDTVEATHGSALWTPKKKKSRSFVDDATTCLEGEDDGTESDEDECQSRGLHDAIANVDRYPYRLHRVTLCVCALLYHDMSLGAHIATIAIPPTLTMLARALADILEAEAPAARCHGGALGRQIYKKSLAREGRLIIEVE